MRSHFRENERNVAFNGDIVNIVYTFSYLFTRAAMLRYYRERSVLHTVSRYNKSIKTITQRWQN